MSEDENRGVYWAAIGERLRAPFDPADVDFRVQGKASEKTGKAQVVCFIDARAVMERLDEAVGPGAWSFSYVPLVVEKGAVQVAKGILSIYGVSKEDVGEASNFDPSKGCVSDALKRAAVLWGIGRYLYDVPSAWVEADQYGHIAPAALRELRSKLPQPGRASGSASARSTETRAAAPAPADAPANITRLDAQIASEANQKALASSLRTAGISGKIAAETFLMEALEREIDILRLAGGTSDITVSEVRQVIAALAARNQARAESAADVVPEGSL